MLDLIDHLPMTPASIEQYLRDGAVRGYTRFVKTIVDKLNGTYQPIPYDIETIINRSIPGDPEHYSAYRNMIMYLGQFIQEAPGEDEYEDREPPEDKDLEIRGLYKAFQNITHGIPITEPDDIGSYSYGLLWAAILSGHDKTFTDLLNSIPKYLIPQVQGFLLGYVAHPLLVRSDQLDQVGRYLRANGDYTTPSDAVTILDQEGYSHLADIIRT